MGCGIGYSTQPALAYSRARSPDLTAQGVTLIGTTGLIEGEDQAMRLALAWALGGERAPGSSSFKHELSSSTLSAEIGLGERLTAFANRGWVLNIAAHAPTTIWNLAAGYAFASGVDALSAVYDSDRSEPWFGTDVGMRRQQLSVDTSYRRVKREGPRTRLRANEVNLTF